MHTKEGNIQNEGEYSNWHIRWQGGGESKYTKLSIQTTQNVRQGGKGKRKIYIAREFLELTLGRKRLQNNNQTQQNTYSSLNVRKLPSYFFISFSDGFQSCAKSQFMPSCPLISSLLGILIT